MDRKTTILFAIGFALLSMALTVLVCSWQMRQYQHEKPGTPQEKIERQYQTPTGSESASPAKSDRSALNQPERPAAGSEPSTKTIEAGLRRMLNGNDPE